MNLCVVRHAQITQNKSFRMSLQYLKKEIRDEVDFYMQINIKKFPTSWFWHFGIKVSYKGILSLLMSMIKQSQSTQSNKFAIYLQTFQAS